ncbi:MAG: sulfite exporter TauE/SafE family protein [Pseudomonadota bacterium]
MPGIDDLSPITLILLAVIFLFAGLVHGTLGVGFPMTATPLLALLTDVRSAIIITILPTMAVNIISIYKGGRWRDSLGKYWPLAVFVGIGSIAGTKALIIIDPAPFKLLLASVILLYLNRRHLKTHWLQGLLVAHPRMALMIFGLVAGFLAGTVNVMVPILFILFLELDATPTVMVQVFNMCFLTAKVNQTIIFSYIGTMNSEVLLTTAPLAVLGILTLLVGMSLRLRVDAQTYRGWMKRFLWVMATGLVVQYFMQI